MTEKKMPVEVYSRVVGYYRPTNQWNRGKQAEFKERYEQPVNLLMANISEMAIPASLAAS